MIKYKGEKKKTRNPLCLSRPTAIIIISVFAIVCFTTYIDLDSADAAKETSGSCGSNLNWTYEPSSRLLTISGEGNMKNYSWDSSRWGNNDVESVIIYSGVTSVGQCAFLRCTSLISVTIPDSVTFIGNDAFSGCTSLASITIPDSVTFIGSDAFSECTSLTSVTIGNSVASIGNGAFSGCASLTSITIPDSVTSIGFDAFSGCASLTSITIPDSVTSISDCAFSGCSSLKSINVSNSNAIYSSKDGVLFNKDKTQLICYPVKKSDTSYAIPDSVTSIGNDAFSECSSLTSITIPDSVISIGDDAFSECSSLTSITISDGVISIGSWVFYGCFSLTSVIIGNGLTSIGDSAFYGCTSLTSITIPDSVTHIGNDVFDICSSLESINVGESNTRYLSEDGILFNKDKTELICYPAKKSDTSYTIPSSVISIGYAAFSGCSPLTSVIIGNSVTSVGDYAFYGCASLTSITIPDSVASIGKGAFCGCTFLTSITIGNNVTSIGEYTFYGCISLESVNVDNSNTKYLSEGGVLFNKDKTELICYPAKKSDTSYTIPDSVTSIGDDAFFGSTSLESINVGESNTRYLSEDGVLFNKNKTQLICYPSKKSDTSYTIPDSIFYIGDSAFYGCTSLTSITIPDGVTDIGRGTFFGCTSLISVTASDDLVLVGNDIFYGCAGLISVTVDNNNIVIESGKTANVFRVNDDYSTGVAVTWISSDESVAAVDSAGIITAVGLGTATIKAVYGERVYAECNVTVSDSIVVSKYKITFKNGDDVLQETEFESGIMPVYSGNIPEKASTAQHTYIFKGWSPEIVAVSGEATYVAEFDEIINKYTVKFVNGDEIVSETKLDYGTNISVPTKIPIKESDAQYTYVFKGWSGYTEGLTVTGNVTFAAEFNGVLNGDSAENESEDYKLIIIGVVVAIVVLSVIVLIFRKS